MKKLKIKLLLFLLTFIFFNKSVYAKFECSINLGARKESLVTSSIKLEWYHFDKTKAVDQIWHEYYLMDKNTSQFIPAYCRESGRTTGFTETPVNFVCNDNNGVIFDTDFDEPNVRLYYDAGLMEILVKGYSNLENHQSAIYYLSEDNYQLTNEEAYTATVIALRAYEMLWPDIAQNLYYTKLYNAPFLYYANTFRNDYVSTIKTITGKEPNRISQDGGPSKWLIGGVDHTNYIVKFAKQLVDAGMNKALEFYKNPVVAKINVKQSASSRTTVTTVPNSNKKTYSFTDTYQINVENFLTNGNSYINISGIDCSNCIKYGVNTEIIIDNKTYKVDWNANENDRLKNIGDLLKMSGITNGSGTLEMQIKFDLTSDNYRCRDEIKYDLKFKYKDSSISNEAYNVHADSSVCSSGNCQNFYILTGENVPRESKISSTKKICTETECEILKESCEESGNQNSQACMNYNAQCKCSSYVSNVACSESKTSFEIKEGYEHDADSCSRPTEENIKSCVINNADENGNSYQSTEIISGNDYCSVWCKEDYEFIMPGNKGTYNLRTLDLKVNITGKKTCYTNNIDNDKFEGDFEQANDKIALDYNIYKYYQAAKSASYTSSYEDDASFQRHSHYVECKEGEEDCVFLNEKWQKLVYAEADYADGGESFYADWEFTPITTDGHVFNASDLATLLGSVNHGHTTCSVSGGTVKCNYRYYGTDAKCSHSTYNGKATCSCRDGSDGQTPASYFSSISLSTLLNNIKNSQQRLNTIINSYNSCSNWAMSYNFNPQINFSYDELYMDYIRNNQLVASGSVTSSSEIRRCAYETQDAAYEECKDSYGRSSWTTNNEVYEKSHLTCNVSSSSVSCSRDKSKINKTINMKESITKTGNYVTPKIFLNIFPHSMLAVMTQNGLIPNSNILENLPVGSRPQGYYDYSLSVENLGEYYFGSKAGQLGRIWGDEVNVVKTTLASTSSCRLPNSALLESSSVNGNDFYDGVYVCHYSVNIPDDDPKCPDCPVVCPPGGACYYDDPKCPSCPVTCPKCLYNGGINVESRPITPDNLNPNDRDLGANWDSGIDPKNPDANVNITTSLQLKAYATTKEIEKDSHTIYDVDFNDTSNNDFAIEVTLDSKMISKIKAYNSRYSAGSGYANDSLKCYDYTSPDGKEFKNIYCYSTFIDELLYDSDTKDKIKIKGNRLIGNSETDTDSLRRSRTQSSGYWTTWDQAKDQSNQVDWHVNITNYNLDYFTTKFGYNSSLEVDYGIGPSWK